MTPARLRILRGASLSGDWRNIGGALELVGMLAVNVPGFPVPRADMELTAAGDVPLALVAAGTGAPDDDMSEEEYETRMTLQAARIELLVG